MTKQQVITEASALEREKLTQTDTLRISRINQRLYELRHLWHMHPEWTLIEEVEAVRHQYGNQQADAYARSITQ